MILVNRNFGNPALSTAIGDMFKSSSDDGHNICWVPHTNVLATGSSLVSTYKPVLFNGGSAAKIAEGGKNLFKNYQPYNLFIVTEHFLKVMDKFYTKIWNESFTESGIYKPECLASVFSGFVNTTSEAEISKIITTLSVVDFTSDINIMLFKKVIDRCITAGVLMEEDRLQYEDQISLNDLNKINLSTQTDLDNKLITFTSAQPMGIQPNIDTREGQYLYGKKLFLMMTPYLTNESMIKIDETLSPSLSNFPTNKYEPFWNYIEINNGASNAVKYRAPVKQPIAFFKPKTPESRFGRSLPLATHLIWRIGTQADKDLAEIEGTEVPEIIFDHLNRISHIDSLKLEIKYDNLQF